MNLPAISKACSLRYLMGISAVVLFAYCTANAQEKSKPAAPKPAAAAPKAAAPAARSATPAAAGRGPTTSGAGRGPTTGGAGRGPTAGGAGRGPAAGGGGRGPANAGARGSAGGGRNVTAAGHPAANGHTTARAANGSAVTRRPGGRVAEVHDARRGMDVHHGLNGGRSVRVEGRDGHRIYAERGGRGYVQSRYSYHGREYGHRTYYEHGRAYDRFYRGYPYHGVYVEMYTPAYYYRPAFYGWAYNPWVAPVPYAWGFAATPWYGYYGVYYTPYPVYPSASVWLTDYMISQTLAAAYQARLDAAAGAQAEPAPAVSNDAPLTPEVKNLIAAEVQRQIALANAESQTVAQNGELDPASSGIQRMLTDKIQHVFVAGKDIDVVDAAGAECAVSQGDALQLTGPPAPDATEVALVVLSSKGGLECKRGITVSVELADLQDMQNHMRETIDSGMGELQTKQGKGGLPALPPSANAPPTKTAFAAEAPPPDPTAATQINQQMGEAEKAEQEVLGQTAAPAESAGQNAPPAAPTAPAGPPKEIALGQTFDQVTAILGQPKTVMDLGAKKIYVYPDMKITFNAGKVTDVQ